MCGKIYNKSRIFYILLYLCKRWLYLIEAVLFRIKNGDWKLDNNEQNGFFVYITLIMLNVHI